LSFDEHRHIRDFIRYSCNDINAHIAGLEREGRKEKKNILRKQENNVYKSNISGLTFSLVNIWFKFHENMLIRSAVSC